MQLIIISLNYIYVRSTFGLRKWKKCFYGKGFLKHPYLRLRRRAAEAAAEPPNRKENNNLKREKNKIAVWRLWT